MKEETKEQEHVYKISKYKKAEKKKRHIGAVLICLIVIFCIAFGVTYYFNAGADNILKTTIDRWLAWTDTTQPSDTGTTEAPQSAESVTRYQLDASGNYKFVPYKKNMLICGKDSLRAVNEKGKELWNHAIAVDIPIVSASDAGVLVSGRGSSTLTVIDDGDVLFDLALEAPLIHANINESGYIVTILDQKGYKGGVTVYSPEGVVLFKTLSGSANILDAKLSPNGKILAVVTLDITSGNAGAGVSLYHIGADEKPFFGVTYTDNLISSAQWYGNKSIGLVGDNYYLKLGDDGSEKFRYDYQGNVLLNFDITSENILAFHVAENDLTSTHGGKVLIVDENGALTGTGSVEGEVKNLCVCDSKVHIITSRGLTAFDRRGKVDKEEQLSQDVRNGYLFRSGNRMLVVSGTVAEILDVR